jgi:RNA polymerase sigma factor (sigma-70 family)
LPGVILAAFGGLRDDGTGAEGRVIIPIQKEGGPVDDPLERFAGLYDLYYRNVLRYALQHAEQGTAEDVVSEAFLIAWRRLADVPEPPLPWLLGVARNLLLKQAEAGRRRRLLADRVAALTSAADMVAWDTAEHVMERAAALEAFASLSERDVEALTLVTWHGLNPREAAAVLGCSPRAFTAGLHRARRRLTTALRAADQAQGFPAHRSPGHVQRAVPPRRPAASTSKEQA